MYCLHKEINNICVPFITGYCKYSFIYCGYCLIVSNVKNTDPHRYIAFKKGTMYKL